VQKQIVDCSINDGHYGTDYFGAFSIRRNNRDTLIININNVKNNLERSGLRIRIRIIFGSWIRIRIRVKSWIRIRIKVKIQKL
jgi:hypothetical protein